SLRKSRLAHARDLIGSSYPRALSASHLLRPPIIGIPDAEMIAPITARFRTPDIAANLNEGVKLDDTSKSTPPRYPPEAIPAHATIITAPIAPPKRPDGTT